MIKWTLVDDFTAVKHHDDGTVEEKKFTSHAQARQFVERHTGQLLAFKHRPHNSHQQRMRKTGASSVPEKLSSEQKALVEKAAKQFKGI